MLTIQQDDFTYRVFYRSFIIAMLLLLVPPLMIYELGGSVLDGSIDRSDLVGLILAIVLPLGGSYYMTEFASFTFSTETNRFSWRWRNLFRKQSGEVPLQRIVRVRRDRLTTSGTPGSKYTYRLVVILDDGSIVPLTQRYSSVHDRQLEQIVDQLREFLGLYEPQA